MSRIGRPRTHEAVIQGRSATDRVAEDEPRSNSLLQPLAAAVGAALALLWGLTLIQPPGVVGTGLDQSWRIGLTLAASEHLHFGRDIVFTFGPWGFVLQGIPSPQLAAQTAALALVIAAVTVAGVWTALRGRASLLQKLAFVAVLIPFSTIATIDYVAVVGVVALLMRTGRAPRLAPFVGLAVGSVALIGALSKYTLGFDVLAAASAAWLIDAIRGPRRRRRATAIAAAVALAVTALGVTATFGFSVAAIASYLTTAAQITLGYADAMVVTGPARQVALALAVGVAILAVAVAAVREGKPSLAAVVLVTLFLTWKHGFVRQDGHIFFYFAIAAVLAPLLGMAVRGRIASFLALGATAGAIGAFVWTEEIVFTALPPYFDTARIAGGTRFLFHPRETAEQLAARVPAALQPDRLQPDVVAQIGPATVDVLPTETAIVLANGLRWDPLPVFQSYSAYTPALDALNRDALVAHGAAYIVYRYEAIDGRLPFAEMPSTMAEILCRYRVARAAVKTAGNGDFVLLRREPGAACDSVSAGSAARAAVGSPVHVPRAGSRDELVTAAFALRPTFAVRVLTALWRAPHVEIDVRLTDGSVKRWRVVPATLRDGVVLSVAPRDPAEAGRFLIGTAVPAVTDVTLIARPGTYILDRVTFTRLRRHGAGAPAG